mgnify:CR=1 FL=1
MVLRRPLSVSPQAEGVHQSDSWVEVSPGEQRVAGAGRDVARRIARRTTLRIDGTYAILWGVFLAVIATSGLIASCVLSLALVAQGDRTQSMRDAAEHMRSLNEACRSELAVTKGELNRMDRLLQYSRGH